MATKRPASIATESSAPCQSKPPGRAASRGNARQASTTATAPSGRCRANSQGQSASDSSTPPMAGPAA